MTAALLAGAQQQHPEAFALLRGLVLSTLLDHRNECAAANVGGPSPNGPAPLEVAQKLYAKVRRAFNSAVACELRHAHATEQCFHVRGQALPTHTPTRRWRDTWEVAGFAELVHGCAKQTLLPATPAAQQQPTRDPTPPAHLPPTTRIIYTDGSGDDSRKRHNKSRTPTAGWGFVALQNGDGQADATAQCTYKAWGPVVSDTDDAYSIGAEACTNNTAELSALGHALAWALQCDPNSDEPLLIRYDSTYAANVMTGVWKAVANKKLAQHVNRLWRTASRQLRGQLWCTHVRAHQGHKWNDEADQLANRGRTHGRGARGSDRRGAHQDAPT